MKSNWYLRSLIIGLALMAPVLLFSQFPGVYDRFPKLDPDELYNEKPIHAEKSIILFRNYYGNDGAFTTDTASIEYFDDKGRRVEYIDFEKNKRSTHYFTTHWDDERYITHYFLSPIANKQRKSITNARLDAQGRKLSVTDSVEVDGKLEVSNEHVFTYNSFGLMLKECHICQNENRLLYHYSYKDSLVISAFMARGDSTNKQGLADFEYDAQGRLIRFIHHDNLGGVKTFNQEKVYTYESDRIVGSSERHFFEDSTMRRFAYTYDSEGKMIKKISSIDTLDKTTTYTYRENKLIRTETVSEFPMSTEISVWFSKKAKFYSKPKITTLVNEFEYDQYGQLIRRSVFVDGVRKRETIWELTYRKK
jgi:hypothetical protein